jgi:geranylgeranyl diphosphate synthase, type II
MDNRVLFKRDLKEKQELVNIILDRFLPRKDEYPKEIHKAIRYSLFAGGKRMRPYLTMLAWQLFNEDPEPITYVAAAIEMLHTYTLIHDDLPDIDNDEYRRGKKSCHAVFGEEVALLAGDALLLSAFELITWSPLPEKTKKEMVHEMAVECGATGLIAGQVLDIRSEGKKPDKKTLEFIHKNKTARLINLALRFGAMGSNAKPADVEALENYGIGIGMAFQIVDDLLDIEGDPAALGKSVGKDIDSQKMTFPSVYGIEKSRQMAEEYKQSAKQALSRFGGKAVFLEMLADYITDRNS